MKKGILAKVSLALIFAYLFFPIVATILFSVATRWSTTILPEGYTLAYYHQLFTSPEFAHSLSRTIYASFATIILSILLIVPSLCMAIVYYPRLEKLFEILSILPFAMPGVILAIGMIQMYSRGPLRITNIPWILIGSYFVLILPFMYQSIKNSFRSLNVKALTEAAIMLGCGKFETFVKLIFPNVLRGVITAALISVSVLFGEFVLANLLVGDNYETIQIYLYKLQKVDVHMANALVAAYFLVILLMSLLLIWLAYRNQTLRTQKPGKRQKLEASS
ncbi:ABC-type spermidine/putrescine transport system, permease component II [Candidatus Desulfosporosinus infrequens]|uniref:ABC-type spermidine/putrescine transport system, permease component II n=1 Tax=Candidatus Desulfosporosinus infrequens TaxID=2043169 RepID=A0A2U3L1X3_9FIRM|nr:ABC-type spermidine/putrescine transport system, permease component II [Candidatus Desulfosporosinus infrequens]